VCDADPLTGGKGKKGKKKKKRGGSLTSLPFHPHPRISSARLDVREGGRERKKRREGLALPLSYLLARPNRGEGGKGKKKKGEGFLLLSRPYAPTGVFPIMPRPTSRRKRREKGGGGERLISFFEK